MSIQDIEEKATPGWVNNPTQTAAAGADTAFSFGNGTTTMNHAAIQNNTAANIFVAFDQSSITSGNMIYTLTPGQFMMWDRPYTTIHFSSAAQQNFGGQTGITVEGFA